MMMDKTRPLSASIDILARPALMKPKAEENELKKSGRRVNKQLH